MAPNIGMCFDPGFPAAAIVDYAERLEAAGIDELWIIEDCFQTAWITLAAAAFALTSRLQVGFGILPASPVRTTGHFKAAHEIVVRRSPWLATTTNKYQLMRRRAHWKAHEQGIQPTSVVHLLQGIRHGHSRG